MKDTKACACAVLCCAAFPVFVRIRRSRSQRYFCERIWREGEGDERLLGIRRWRNARSCMRHSAWPYLLVGSCSFMIRSRVFSATVSCSALGGVLFFLFFSLWFFCFFSKKAEKKHTHTRVSCALVSLLFVCVCCTTLPRHLPGEWVQSVFASRNGRKPVSQALPLCGAERENGGPCVSGWVDAPMTCVA